MNPHRMMWAGAAVIGIFVTVRLALFWGGEIFKFRTGGTPTQPELTINLLTDAMKSHPPSRHAVNLDGMVSFVQLVLLTTAAGFTVFCVYKTIKADRWTNETDLESSAGYNHSHHGP